MEFNDVSPKFRYNPIDAEIGKKLLKFEKTPLAVQYFSRHCAELTDYGYWFLLSTIWVSYTGFSDLQLWKELFNSQRPFRTPCIMKPSEVEEFNKLNNNVTIYRAHRENETDCISYTLNKNIAFRFAKERDVKSISEYKVKKKDILALFLRRGEDEIIVLDKNKVRPKATLNVYNF